MTTVTADRRDWTCPSCGRRFRIPVDATNPDRCPECPPAKPKPPSVKAVTVDSADAKPDRVDENVSLPPTSESRSTSSTETQEILEHLRNISRTMTLFRRSVWIFLAISILRAVVSFFAMKQMTDAIGGMGDIDGGSELNNFLQELNGQ